MRDLIHMKWKKLVLELNSLQCMRDYRETTWKICTVDRRRNIDLKVTHLVFTRSDFFATVELLVFLLCVVRIGEVWGYATQTPMTLTFDLLT